MKLFCEDRIKGTHSLSGAEVGGEKDSWSVGSPVPGPDWEDPHWEGISFHLNMTHLLSSGPGGKILPTHPETSSGEILWWGSNCSSVSGALKTNKQIENSNKQMFPDWEDVLESSRIFIRL